MNLRNWGVLASIAMILTCFSNPLVQAQSTLILPAQADAVVGFHDGFNSANNNYGTANHYSATSQPSAAGSGDNTSRSLVSFNLAALPAGATVVSAQLNLFGRGAIGPGAATSIGNTGDNIAYLQRITSSWSENTVTWNTKPTSTTTNQVTIGPYAAISQDINIDVTQLVLDMLADPASSFGIQLRLVTESPTRHIGFWSREATDVVLRPTLEIVYDCTISTPVVLSESYEPCSGYPATVNAGGGYSMYIWSNGETTQIATATNPGNYSVTVTDANGCSGTAGIELFSVPPPLTVSFDVVGSGCGPVQINTTEPFATYVWNTGETTASIEVEQSGVYSVTVTELINGCVRDGEVEVNAISSITLDGELTYPTCATQGSINLSVFNGTAPYEFAWTNGATSEDISQLDFGTYGVTVTDVNGCSATETFVLQTSIVLPVTADAIFGFHDGFNSANVNYGSFTHIAATSQPSAASGENAARSALTFNLSSLPAGTTVVAAYLNLYGSGPTDGSGAATSVGNIGDNVTYIQRVTSLWQENTVTWNTQPSTTVTNQVTVGPVAAISADLNIDVTQLVLDMLADPANSFGFEMRLATEDPTRNLSFRSREFADSSKHPTLTLVFGNTVGSNVSASIAIDSANCNLSYVELTATGIGGTMPYAYSWNNGATTQSIVADGAVFSVTITDADGCAAVDSIFLLPTPPVFVEITGDLTVCPGTTATLTASPDGMSGYLWSNGQITQSISVGAGSYSVTVFAGECPAGSADATVSTNPLPSLATTVTNATGGNNGAIDLTLTGNGSPFTYAWSNGATTQDINGLAPSTYTVTVTTFEGCTSTTSATVTQATGCALTVNVSGVNLVCHGVKTGTATAIVSGATGPFTYAWSNGKTTQTIIKLSAGTYTVTVTASNGCTATGSVTITQPTNIAAYITCQKVCPGACNGSATVTVFSGGVSPFTYAWSNGQTNATANGLCAGIYWVTVTDANGCKKIVGTMVTTATVGCGLAVRMDTGADLAPMSVYPNPADQVLNVVPPAFDGHATLRVINALGQTVATMQVNGINASVNVSGFAAGVYHLQFESNGLVETAKFIKQ